MVYEIDIRRRCFQSTTSLSVYFDDGPAFRTDPIVVRRPVRRNRGKDASHNFPLPPIRSRGHQAFPGCSVESERLNLAQSFSGIRRVLGLLLRGITGHGDGISDVTSSRRLSGPREDPPRSKSSPDPRLSKRASACENLRKAHYVS